MRMAPSGKSTANVMPMMVPCAVTAVSRLGLTCAHAGFAGHGQPISIEVWNIWNMFEDWRNVSTLKMRFYKGRTKPEGQHNGRELHIDRHDYQSLLWMVTGLVGCGERNSQRLRI